MLTLTRGAIFGFTLLVLALLCAIISIASPSWYQVQIKGLEDPSRTLPKEASAALANLASANWGLWHICTSVQHGASAEHPPHLHLDSRCESLVSQSYDFIRAAQATMVLGLVCMLAAVISGILFLIARGNDKLMVFFSVVGCIAGGALVLVGTVLFSIFSPRIPIWDYDHHEQSIAILELVRLKLIVIGHFDWGFGVGVTSGILSVLGAAFATVQWERRTFVKTYTEDNVPLQRQISRASKA